MWKDFRPCPEIVLALGRLERELMHAKARGQGEKTSIFSSLNSLREIGIARQLGRQWRNGALEMIMRGAGHETTPENCRLRREFDTHYAAREYHRYVLFKRSRWFRVVTRHRREGDMKRLGKARASTRHSERSGEYIVVANAQ